MRPLRVLSAVAAALLLLLSPTAGRVASRPAAAATPRMNVVLVLTDDQTMESVARMPYVGSRGDWLRFSSAWIENPLCCPSRATILTGQYDTHTGVLDNSRAGRLDARPTLPVWLRAAGYRTGLFGKYLNDYPFGRGSPYVPPGWTDWQAVYQGVYKQYDYSLSENGRWVHFGTAPGDYAVDELADRAAGFIGSNAASPFFLYFAPTRPISRGGRARAGRECSTAPPYASRRASTRPTCATSRSTSGASRCGPGRCTRTTGGRNGPPLSRSTTPSGVSTGRWPRTASWTAPS